jgi:2-polyprenyl-3-methyl-5-hydroxy-6-metoxy-1,4-benzoquinol methylase
MRQCAICKQTNLALMYDHVRDHYKVIQREYQFWRCENCGSAILHPFPSHEEIPSFYPPNYVFKINERKKGLRRLLDRLQRRLFYDPIYHQKIKSLMKMTELRNGRVLDVGCGSGLLLEMLAKKGFDVAGTEVSAEDVRHAQENFGIKVFRGALKEARFPDAGFDAVTLFNVIEHLPDPFETLCEVWRILKPGGWVALDVPLIDSRQSSFFKDRWAQITEAPRHIWIPSSKGIRTILKRAGFNEVTTSNVSILAAAAFIALSLYPASAVIVSSDGMGGFVRRVLGGVIATLSIPIAFAERMLSSGDRPCGAMLFFGRKQEGS